MEIWKDILQYEGYYRVSNLGNVYSVKRNKLLKPTCGTNVYLSVNLYKNGYSKTFMIHRLVAICFLENINNKQQVNHKDHNRQNNNVSNLEWVSQSENVKHSYKNINRKIAKAWIGKLGNKHNRSKGIYEFDNNGQLLNYYESGLDFQRKTGINHSSASWAIKNNKPIFYKYYSRNPNFEMR